jgi:hypothetical protein
MLQPALDEIDAMLAPYLKKELAEENAATRATAKQKADLARFKNAALSGNCLPFPHCPRRLRSFLLRNQITAQRMWFACVKHLSRISGGGLQ